MCIENCPSTNILHKSLCRIHYNEIKKVQNLESRKRKKLEREEMAKNNIKIQCQGECQEYKSVHDFETDRNICKTCRKKYKKIKADSKSKEDSTYPEKCGDCGVLFDENLFQWRNDYGGWRSICRNCRNEYHKEKDYSHKRWEKNKNNLNYRIKNAENSKNYRANNNTIKKIDKIKEIENNANKRNIYFDTDQVDLFKKLINQNCYYCNSENQEDKINGLDRKLNDLGYTKDNVVSCCSTCNYMKGVLSFSKFISHIRKICLNFSTNSSTTSSHINIIDEKTLNQKFLQIKKRSIEKFHEDINEQDIKKKISMNCKYCNEINTETGNGIDRIDNNQGYSIENTNPSCYTCNRIKYVFEIEHFKAQVNRIYHNTLSIDIKEDDLSVEPKKKLKKLSPPNPIRKKLDGIPTSPFIVYMNNTPIGKFNSKQYLLGRMNYRTQPNWLKNFTSFEWKNYSMKIVTTEEFLSCQTNDDNEQLSLALNDLLICKKFKKNTT